MVAARRLVGLARGGAASQPGPDGGRTDEQDEITPLDRHPDTLPRVRRAAVAVSETTRNGRVLWPKRQDLRRLAREGAELYARLFNPPGSDNTVGFIRAAAR